MENASKALLIAGGVLLMILVFSFATFIFARIGSQTSEFYEEMDETKVSEFNQQFFNYENKSSLRIQDIVTIINLAKNNNEKGIAPVVITVMYNGDEIQNKSKSEIMEMLSNNLDSSYTCTVEYAVNSKYVGKITILQNKT